MKQIFLSLILFFSFCEASNSLKYESSPYLVQHSNNPVNWMPWNKNSLELAKKENKLIFVSIGYSTCHWCHVMRDESFEDKEIAKALNKEYISIKIDREELPHIDSFYQTALNKLTNSRNGWPLNFILTPKKELILISTYIPNSFNYGLEGLDTLIPRISYEYKNGLLNKTINSNKKVLESKSINNVKYSNSFELEYIKLMEKKFDGIFKGFFKQPKFPLASNLNFLYELSLLKDNLLKTKAFNMFVESLDNMAYGGIFDQVEGGFYRYSVYADWIIPHFEKMLYTQAELLPLYYRLYNKTKDKKYKDVIIKTIDFLNENFKTKNALYYSASDADSKNAKGEKQEGYYYAYIYDDTKEELEKEGIENSEEVLAYLGFDDFGNFEDELNNVYINRDFKRPTNLDEALEVLKKIRKNKSKPFIDKKIITSWNALMIKAMFEVSSLDKSYLEQAVVSLDSLIENLYVDKILFHQKIESKKLRQKALLEDYSFLIDVLLRAYEFTYKDSYLELSEKLIGEVLNKFYKDSKWYFDEDKEYVVSFNDKYYVSAISRMFHNMLSFSNLTFNLELLEKTKSLINEQKELIIQNLYLHPEGLRSLIRVKKGDIVIKSNKQNLLSKQEEIESIKYPFILRYKENSKLFLACDESSCFAYDKELKNIIKIIEK